MALKIQIGGSPCTKWSIAQKNNRETTAEGIGWELFKNYLIAKEKFKPDLFLYENNKSAAEEIKQQIAEELKVGIDPNARFTYINSALVSAQTRNRFYVTNFGDINQPSDRSLFLPDILECGEDLLSQDKSLCLVARYSGATPKHTIEKHMSSMAVEAVRVGALPRPNGALSTSQGMRVYSTNGKSVNLTANGGGLGGKTGLYAIPVEFDGNVPQKAISNADGKTYTVYVVADGKIHIKGNDYPIKLNDGYYIIRKLTVNECERLQTLPDGYCKSVSDNQAYKAIGNGWTAEVIIHLLHHALKDVPRNTEIVVLSLYDGIATGRYCLDKMGFTNVIYHSYEIDKYAIQVAMDNYPDIIQHGDAFAVREDTWKPPQTHLEWLDELLEVV